MRYQELIEKHNFMPTAYLQRLNLTINSLARRRTARIIERNKAKQNLAKNPWKEVFKEAMKA